MKKICSGLIVNKTKIIAIYINLLYIYYILQFSHINDTFLKLILLFTYSLFPIILIAKRFSFKNFIMIGLICLFGYSITQFDSRYLSVLTIFFVLWNEDNAFIFKSLIITSSISLIIGLIVGIKHINGFSVCLGLLTYLLFLSGIVKKFKQYIIIYILLNILLIGYIRSGQAIICINFCFVLFLLIKKNHLLKMLNKKIWVFAFVLCAFLNIYLALSTHSNGFLYINKILPSSVNSTIDMLLNLLDKALNYRMSLSNISLNLFGFKLYGNVLNPDHPQLIGSYFNVDSGYLQVLQCQGLIIFITILLSFTIIMFYFYRTHKTNLIIIGLTIALWAINEDILLSPVGNILWIFLPEAINYFIETYWKKELCFLKQRKE